MFQSWIFDVVGVISANGRADLVFVLITMKTEVYLKILGVLLLAHCVSFGTKTLFARKIDTLPHF